MEEKYFIWDNSFGGLLLTESLKAEDEKKKDKRKTLQTAESKIYCPHERLAFNFKETLSFIEQSKFRKLYQRKHLHDGDDVVLLQDIKDLAFILLISPISLELIRFLHLPIVDRFLRALILYLQNYLTTWTELGAKRAATARRAANPLAGGARVQRADEMRALRCVLAREYADLLSAYQPEGRKFHHADAGQMSFVQSRGEKDFRIFEGLIQFAHRVAWIALERKNKELIEVEMHRLFRTDAYSIAKRKYEEIGFDLEVPEDEHWILYGSKMPARRKILRNSPLCYEVLHTDCDYRILSLGLTNAKSQSPCIMYLENALLAKEEDLLRLGIKVGILGLPRTDFDLLLIPQASENDQIIIDETPVKEDERADDYETLIPPCGSDLELDKPFKLDKISLRYVGDEKLRYSSKKKWMVRELKRASLNYTETISITTTLN